jgi:pimeloyl-ACP methyl ester carboxylesterase
MQSVNESAVVFGQFNGLVGIVSEPADGADGGRASGETIPLAVVILNTGIIHRVGAGRLSTIWARHLAAAGHCVMRFDLSGVGDSERRNDNLPPTDGALADIRDAVDWLQAVRGIHRVILVGLCSGADLSLLYGGTDPRIVGTVIIDASTPPTRGHYLRKLLTLKLWKRQFLDVLSRIRAERHPHVTPTPADQAQFEPLGRDLPPIVEILTDAYRAAFAKKVRILAIFTSGAAWYNYRNQLYDAFPTIHFDGNLRLEYFQRCDHLITHEANRTRLFDVVDSWLASTEFKHPMVEPESQHASAVISDVDSGDLISVEF